MTNRIKDTNLKKASYSGYRSRLDFGGAQEQEIHRASLKKSLKMRFIKILIIFLFIGLILLFRHNIIQIKVITTIPKTTFAGEGIFVQSYEKCFPRIKMVFNPPECRFISKTGKGYLVKIPRLKTSLKIVTFKAKTTIVGKNIFVQSLKRCPLRFKLTYHLRGDKPAS